MTIIERADNLERIILPKVTMKLSLNMFEQGKQVLILNWKNWVIRG
ncbi:hypothetical protein P7J56_09445 [Streptococcus suis]